MNAVITETRTRIVATLGPASSTPEALTSIIEAGADVIRLNLSHATPESHVANIRMIREVERTMARPIAIMADLPGPKIRLHADERCHRLESGTEVELRLDDGDGPGLRVDQPDALKRLESGHRVLLDDGAIRMLVIEVTDGSARCSVLHGGDLRSRVGVNLPDTELAIPAVGERDRELAKLVADNGVDFIAVSFCRDGDDLRGLREELGAEATATWLVAKIERPVAVERFDDILDAADVILVARGDLGVEMDVARVPLIQKRLMEEASRRGRPVIVATQMLQSMIEANAPTRAEASDVANAVLDGADAVMLSGETAIGHHPTLAVETMNRIIEATEEHHGIEVEPDFQVDGFSSDSSWMPSLVRGAWQIAADLQPRFIGLWSSDGEAARFFSRAVLPVPILVYTSSVGVLRRMQLLRGIEGVLVDTPSDRAAFFGIVERHLREAHQGCAGELCLLFSTPRFTTDTRIDSVSVLSIGEVVDG
ncbi:MAG: pyruvate kinase [Phycisphaerales bacterium]|nr:pyruvate kinase [Phycisphaerales bacterium]